ncbi:respiratory nitrate reductase subunit gamma [Azospirillum ramasamyi]|uniref:nitrate reductase (quinone) n=1 Tax=Azospirillum ramasamyi TaxID=682998 RepID=A0A2U9SBQ8_9PROT|nr:respiratory nitrate reductase subunit gamma [Azospirillum ramasamyi]AWU96882.1 respiratory nitrate reductase subunit gamma [Azospirillum ramasamyi]
MDWLNQFLFGFFPYLCMIAFFLGSWARFDRSQFSWRSQSSQFLNRHQLVWASNLFHIGILGLFVGHFVGLLTPPSWQHALGLSVKEHQWMAIVFGGIFALLGAIGGLGLIVRRVFNLRVRRTSKPTDMFILFFIYFQLWLGIVGIPVSVANSDGTYMLVLSEWCRNIMTFQPGSAALVQDVPWIYKLHLVAGMTLFLLVPFTRMVHVWSAPIWFIARPAWQIVRRNANIAKEGV